ncbi:MAG: hypothetical protein K2N31_01620 [Treponemataceae bacterium]|nr:hypothetical protein [Treponemataceae bacterium]
MCFKNDLTIPQAADICGVNRNIANRYYNLLRRVILSESIRKTRGRGVRNGRVVLRRKVAGKMPVFGLLKRDEKMFVTVVL